MSPTHAGNRTWFIETFIKLLSSVMITHPDAQTFVLENGLISRTITFDKSGLYTSRFVNLISGSDYVFAKGSEFFFELNKTCLFSLSDTRVKELDGVTEESLSDFELTGFDTAVLDDDSETLTLHLIHKQQLRVDAVYHIYPGIAGIRKHLEMTNISDEELVLEKIHYDNIMFSAGAAPADCIGYLEFDKRMAPCFAVDASEDSFRIHNHNRDEGYFFGTNAPGALRSLIYYPQWGKSGASYNMGGAFFRKSLAPQEKFVTHDSLISLYCGRFEDVSCADGYRDLVRKKLPKIPKEGIMYCTWLPFLLNISEELVNDIVGHAAEMGFDYLVLDDGWFKPKSNWQVFETKFPNGLEAVSKQVHDAGLKFGLWFNIGSDYGMEECNLALAARSSDGTPKPLNDTRTVMCFGSEWRFLITEKLIQLAETYQVDYFKLDFSSITSPYCTQEWGCHSKEHRFHKNYNDSILAMYEGLHYLRCELKKRFPDLLVDFSFETFGPARPSAAALEYSEIHHISNLSANNTTYQSIEKVRNAFYNWLKVMPPERVLNGLLSIQGERGLEYFLTSLAGAPLVAGDLRKLDPDIKKRIKTCCDAFKKVTKKGELTTFEVVCDTLEQDGYIRRAKDGRAICCLFNRKNDVWKTDIQGFRNVENGSTSVEVAPNDCAMFIKGV